MLSFTHKGKVNINSQIVGIPEKCNHSYKCVYRKTKKLVYLYTQV